MIDFYVSGQTLKFFSPVIAADSLDYLTARVSFSGDDWEGCSKWLHFRQGEILYDVQLDENDEITADKGINLSLGQWEIFLTGTRESSRLTTVPVILTVQESGLIDAPLHELPLSVAEQVDYNAKQALSYARAVAEAAEAGEFDGRDGTSFSPLGYFETVEQLEAAGLEPLPGDVYGVGSEAPYALYVWDGLGQRWLNNGSIQGPQGRPGRDGATFIPSLDENGNLSWLNDGGLENPPSCNIMGPKGEKGDTGAAGPGAFEKAQDSGYTGTADSFYSALGYMPYHNKRHLPDGPDPITVHSGNLAEGAVSPDKLSAEAKSRGITVVLTAAGWLENAQSVAVAGVTAVNNVLVAAAPASRTAYNDAEIYCSAQAEGSLSFSCGAAPDGDVSVNVVILP